MRCVRRGRRGWLRAVSLRYIVIERYDIQHPGLRDAHTHISWQWRCGQQICWVYGNSDCAASDKWSTKQQKWRQLQGLKEWDSTIHAHTYARGETTRGRVNSRKESRDLAVWKALLPRRKKVANMSLDVRNISRFQHLPGWQRIQKGTPPRRSPSAFAI